MKLKIKVFFLILILILLVENVAAEWVVDVGDSSVTSSDWVVDVNIPATPENKSTFNVNSSDLWDDLDTPDNIDLNDLGDVVESSPNNDEVLTYDSGSWINKAVASIINFITRDDNVAWANETNIFTETNHFTQNVSFADNITIGDNVLYVDSSSGRVGIGTSSPAALTEISSATVNKELLRLTRDLANDKYVSFFSPSGSPTKSIIKATGVDSAHIYTDTEGDFVTGDWRFDKNIFVDENVGIGTSSPTHKLSVEGDVNITGDTVLSSDGTQLTIRDKSSGRDATMTMGIYASDPFVFSTYNSWDFYVDGSSVLDINAGDVIISQDVGIGTTAPTHTLNVVGDANITQDVNIGGDGTQRNITLYSPDGTAWNCGVQDNGVFSCG